MSNFNNKIVFIDESGGAELNQDHKLFVLTAIIMDKENYAIFVHRILKMKFALFGHNDVILHYHDILRNKNFFKIFHNNKDLKNKFYQEYVQHIKDLPCQIITVIYDKKVGMQNAYKFKKDMYSHLLEFILSRINIDFGNKRKTVIFIEKRNPKQNEQLKQAIKNIISGENNCQFDKIFNMEVRFISKDANLEGLQLADICTTEIARWALQNPHSNKNLVDAIKCKFRKNPRSNLWITYGLIIYPDIANKNFPHIIG